MQPSRRVFLGIALVMLAVLGLVVLNVSATEGDVALPLAAAAAGVLFASLGAVLVARLRDRAVRQAGDQAVPAAGPRTLLVAPLILAAVFATRLLPPGPRLATGCFCMGVLIGFGGTTAMMLPSSELGVRDGLRTAWREATGAQKTVAALAAAAFAALLAVALFATGLVRMQ
jgi:hypothetical protein